VRRFTFSTALKLTFSLAGFEVLTKAATPSAFHDYGHQIDVPRCHENTRVAVLEKIDDWVHLVIEITAFIMWLYGAAGAGKSAIARTMAEKLHSRQQLLATFFFSRADSSRNTIKSVIATLAYNIALSVPESRPLIVATIENDPLILNRSFAHQLEELILGPLRNLSWKGVKYPKWGWAFTVAAQHCLYMIVIKASHSKWTANMPVPFAEASSPKQDSFRAK